MKNQKDENVGKRIRVLRTAAGLKQKELAAAVGIQPNSLSLIESGKREPSLSLLRSIASKLDVPMELFFSSYYSDKSEVKKADIVNQLKDLLMEMERLRLAEEKT